MMKNTMASVQKLVDQELKMANEQYPLFASDHEGAAVILEEIEEAQNDMDVIKAYYDYLWADVKEDRELGAIPDNLKHRAIHCACECIQVAAMCEKIKLKKE